MARTRISTQNCSLMNLLVFRLNHLSSFNLLNWGLNSHIPWLIIRYLPTKQVVFKAGLSREKFGSQPSDQSDTESESTFDVIPHNKLCFLC